VSFRIAIAGKGGSGKTTVSALLVDRLIARGCRPVLAVDADPNTCLDAALGVKVENTVGRVREDARDSARQGMSGGISKQELLELKISESLVETEDFDLIAMGRSEGPGCYCYANNVLQGALARLSDHYPYLVLDNEAGLENLARRIVRDVDLLIGVTNASRQGITTIRRIYELAGEMGLKYRQSAIIVNQMRGAQLPPGADELPRLASAELFGLTYDHQLADFAEAGRSLRELPADNPVVNGIAKLIDRLKIKPSKETLA
jgi:CO dehydrogenase maturation factor